MDVTRSAKASASRSVSASCTCSIASWMLRLRSTEYKSTHTVVFWMSKCAFCMLSSPPSEESLASSRLRREANWLPMAVGGAVVVCLRVSASLLPPRAFDPADAPPENPSFTVEACEYSVLRVCDVRAVAPDAIDSPASLGAEQSALGTPCPGSTSAAATNADNADDILFSLSSSCDFSDDGNSMPK